MDSESAPPGCEGWMDQLHLLSGGGLLLCEASSTECFLLEGSEVAAGGLAHTKLLPPCCSCPWTSLTSLSLSNLHGFAYIVTHSPICF